MRVKTPISPIAIAMVALVVAAAFTFAAGVAVAVPHNTGLWLPLHLFLVGGMLTAISII